jgi:hypothetical protein
MRCDCSSEAVASLLQFPGEGQKIGLPSREVRGAQRRVSVCLLLEAYQKLGSCQGR